jgi:anaerobic dimethyl sulfoxide reductase subunit A
MTTELAKRMGVEQFTEGRTQEGGCVISMSNPVKRSRRCCRLMTCKQGIFKQRDPEGHHVAYKAFREDPQPIRTTPSENSKSAQLAEIAATPGLPEEGCYRSAADIQPWV